MRATLQTSDFKWHFYCVWHQYMWPTNTEWSTQLMALIHMGRRDLQNLEGLERVFVSFCFALLQIGLLKFLEPFPPQNKEKSFLSLCFFMRHLKPQSEESHVSYCPFRRKKLSFALKYCFFSCKCKFAGISTELSYAVFSHLVHGDLGCNNRTRNWKKDHVCCAGRLLSRQCWRTPFPVS